MLSKNKLKEGRCCLNNDYFQFKSTEMGGGSQKNCFSSYFCQSSPSDTLWNSSLKVFSFVCICWSWFSKINSKYQTSLTVFRFLVALTTLCLGFWGCFYFFHIIDHEYLLSIDFELFIILLTPIIGPQYIPNDDESNCLHELTDSFYPRTCSGFRTS